jgi:hypothetical protein
MNLMIRKSKTISFRLSPEEHQRLKDTCLLQGQRSISDLARCAMQTLIASAGHAVPLSEEVRDLRSRVGAISLQLQKLATQVSVYRGEREEVERQE